MVLLCETTWSEDQVKLDDLWSFLYLPCMYDSAKLIAHAVSKQETDEKGSYVYHTTCCDA